MDFIKVLQSGGVFWCGNAWSVPSCANRFLGAYATAFLSSCQVEIHKRTNKVQIGACFASDAVHLNGEEWIWAFLWCKAVLCWGWTRPQSPW
ncbi:MAG: hypothetical protein KA838_05095, partial [Burkholderiaceae bacterium]|nr:hypothetical protein [Burkholderiaceae bacterium]